MKRTTYIILGLMLAGLLVMSGIIFYTPLYTPEWKETFMEVKGEQHTIVLPVCAVVKITQPQIACKQKKEGVVEVERCVVSFRKVPLTVSSTDSLQGSFSLAGDMVSFVSVTSVGDTAFITFDIPTEKLEKRFQDARWLKIESERMRLNIPTAVQAVLVDVEGMETDFRGFRCDTLSFQVLGFAKVEDCQVAWLTAEARTLRFNSGEVRDLHLNLDNIINWEVNTDSFHIDTEYLTGGGNHHCTLQKGECRQVLWIPRSGDASLNVKLNQASRIEPGEGETFYKQ